MCSLFVLANSVLGRHDGGRVGETRRERGRNHSACRSRRVLRLGRAAFGPDAARAADRGGRRRGAGRFLRGEGLRRARRDAGPAGARAVPPSLVRRRALPGVSAARRCGDRRAWRFHAAGRAHLDRRGLRRRRRLHASLRTRRRRSPWPSGSACAASSACRSRSAWRAPSIWPRSPRRSPSPTGWWWSIRRRSGPSWRTCRWASSGASGRSPAPSCREGRAHHRRAVAQPQGRADAADRAGGGREAPGARLQPGSAGDPARRVAPIRPARSRRSAAGRPSSRCSRRPCAIWPIASPAGCAPRRGRGGR